MQMDGCLLRTVLTLSIAASHNIQSYTKFMRCAHKPIERLGNGTLGCPFQFCSTTVSPSTTTFNHTMQSIIRGLLTHTIWYMFLTMPNTSLLFTGFRAIWVYWDAIRDAYTHVLEYYVVSKFKVMFVYKWAYRWDSIVFVGRG